MLFISLILSALLLLIANASVRGARHAGASILGFSLAFVLGPFFLMCALPVVTIQALLICVAFALWRASGRRPSSFLPLSCGATMIAYVISGVMVLKSEREYARLRLLYPYESMEGRLPVPRPTPIGATLPRDTRERLYQLEGRIGDHPSGFREYQLRRLHEDAVGLFINSAGFGVARMILPNERSLALSLRREPVPPQPGTRFTTTWSPGESEKPPEGDENALGRLFEDSIVDFVNPRGFGYVKDRRHMAGFETHRFSAVPGPAIRWKVQALELVSLLLHDEPEVYVSDHLPKMERRRGVPTRPLDRFEAFGLDALEKGEDLFMTREKEGVRMLGAVRSTKQCLACHGGDRGDLLGAFSYALMSVGP